MFAVCFTLCLFESAGVSSMSLSLVRKERQETLIIMIDFPLPVAVTYHAS
jgi:hypothetical protein